MKKENNQDGWEEQRWSKVRTHIPSVSEWVKSLSRVWLFATPWIIVHQAPSSMGVSREEYWSGLPFPSPGDLLDPGVEPRAPALQADTLTSEPPGKPIPSIATHKQKGGIIKAESPLKSKSSSPTSCTPALGTCIRKMSPINICLWKPKGLTFRRA